MAVGNGYTASSTYTLAESFDGAAWSPAVKTKPGLVNNILTGVSCTSATHCIAVGAYNSGANQPFHTLIDVWDGIQWSKMTSVDRAGVSSVLNDVSCTSATSCVAVGYSFNTTGAFNNQTLAEVWDGSKWSIVSSPNGVGGDSQFYGVSCTSATNCLAVGSPLGAGLPFTERWDGVAWSLVPTPLPNGGNAAFRDVSCISATNCVAVGFTNSPQNTFIERWDGSAMSLESSPNVSGQSNFAAGVSCVTATTCVAVGGDYGDGGTHTLALRSIVTTPDVTITSPADGAFFGVGQNVTADYGCTAGTAGLESCVGSVPNGTQLDTSTPGTYDFSVTATDLDGASTTVTHTYTIGIDTTPPTISFNRPADGATFVQGQQLSASFSCSDDQTGVATCDGDVADGATFDTATVGTHTFTVNTTDAVGNSATVTHTYTVAADAMAPSVTITRPADGATFAQGASITALYTCLDPQSGVSECTGSVANGTPIDTSVPGTYAFTVNASDGVGNTVTVTHTFTVTGATAPSCPTPRDGSWLGTWSSSVSASSGSGQSQLAFSGATMTGSITFTTADTLVTSGTLISGSVSCNTVQATIDTAEGPEVISGTLSPDGTDLVGTYASASDSGTFRSGWVQQAVSTNGYVLTTDTSGVGTTPATPLQTSVSSPTAGALSIGQADSAGMTLSGYYLVGQAVHIVAPPASPSQPLIFTFQLDASVAGGTTAAGVSVFRNGALVADCISDEIAIPDPCVLARTDLLGGNVQLTVLSSGASVWALGISKTISVGSSSALEGDTSKPRTVSFPVTLTAPPSTTLTVHYAVTANGSATGGSKAAPNVDFKTKAGTVTFKAGSSATTKYITATVYPDAAVEGDETFDVTLSKPTGGYALGASHAAGTIIDDDPANLRTADVGDTQLWEGNAGKTNTAQILVTLSNPSSNTLTVVASVGGGTAESGTDYKKSFIKTLTFLAGQTQKTISVPAIPDTAHEGDETILVTLTNPSNGLTLGRATGTITINNDD
jgi:hypothetical protein